MTFDKLNRRTHLYSGLVLIPWFLLYAISGFVFNHPSTFASSDQGEAKWSTCYERPYHLPAVTEQNEDALAQQLLKDQGLTGRYWTDFDDQDNFVVYRARFLKTVRFTYYAGQSRIRMEEQPLGIARFLTSAHVRSGFDYPDFLELLWGAIVDIVAVAIIVWIVSGIYIWWKLKRFRFWGWSAIAAGFATFILLALGI
ncbi:MAG TPA: PepSY domain-containing protein [Bryobacteraceae bacterium]